MVTQVNVWDAPGAVSGFYMERVPPLVQTEGEPAHERERNSEPVYLFAIVGPVSPRTRAEIECASSLLNRVRRCPTVDGEHPEVRSCHVHESSP